MAFINSLKSGRPVFMGRIRDSIKELKFWKQNYIRKKNVDSNFETKKRKYFKK